MNNLDGRYRDSQSTTHPGMGGRTYSKRSQESWCTCDEEQALSKDVKDPTLLPQDLEAQRTLATSTSFFSDKKVQDAHVVRLTYNSYTCAAADGL